MENKFKNEMKLVWCPKFNGTFWANSTHVKNGGLRCTKCGVTGHSVSK